VLHWLFQGQWHWIYTGDYRMNNRACGIEWLSAPILLFTRSDRGLFLLNFLPFLLLPSLVYGVYTELGIARRVAWSWMWVLPTGYSFLLQAGSIANDTFPTVYALAAIYFGTRARRTGDFRDLVISTLSIALLTGAKASNLPLLLPWLVVILPVVRMVRGHLAAGAIALALAALVSFLPTAALNIAHCGDWSGLVLERRGMDMKDPVVGVWGNLLLFASNNLFPPFFPFAGWWNRSILSLLPTFMRDPLVGNFESGFHMVWELQHEDWSGLGFGVTALLLVSTVWAFFKWPGALKNRRWEVPAPAQSSMLPASWRWAVFAAAWIALLAYCVKSGMVTGARLISPYYFLLVPVLLVHPGHAFVVRQRPWRLSALLVIALGAAVIVVNPPRPLFPARTIFAASAAHWPGNRLLQRARATYEVYRNRSDPMPGIRHFLPTNEREVGFLGDPDDMDISLWKPYGQRRVKHVLLDDRGDQIRSRGIRYVVVSGGYLASQQVSLDDWLNRVDAQLIGTEQAATKVSDGMQPWHAVLLK
jgi:hypothetical protein